MIITLPLYIFEFSSLTFLLRFICFPSWGIKNNIDFIAASFVRKASDVTEIRQYAADLIQELYPNTAAGNMGMNSSINTFTTTAHPLPHIIAKIESVEALVNFDAILAASDGIMVARGDLAVEIPMESLANVQKEIVKRCNLAGKVKRGNTFKKIEVLSMLHVACFDVSKRKNKTFGCA